MSTEFKPVPIARFARLAQRQTAETRFWEKLKTPLVVKEFGAVTSLNFSPSSPHELAATCSTRVSNLPLHIHCIEIIFLLLHPHFLFSRGVVGGVHGRVHEPSTALRAASIVHVTTCCCPYAAEDHVFVRNRAGQGRSGAEEKLCHTCFSPSALIFIFLL